MYTATERFNDATTLLSVIESRTVREAPSGQGANWPKDGKNRKPLRRGAERAIASPGRFLDIMSLKFTSQNFTATSKVRRTRDI